MLIYLNLVGICHFGLVGYVSDFTGGVRIPGLESFFNLIEQQ